MWLSFRVFIVTQVNCEGQPWVITPRESRYLYVQIRGVLIRGAKSVEQNNITSAGVKCTTKNRVLIHSGSDVHVLVCPLAAEPQRHHLVSMLTCLLWNDNLYLFLIMIWNQYWSSLIFFFASLYRYWMFQKISVISSGSDL